jgi:PAS domain S-box-containing protein
VPAISKFLGYRCVLSVPMVAEGATIGLVDVGRATAFDAREVERFVVIAEQLTALVHRRLVQDTLRSSEERVRSLFEGIPVALFRISSDGVVIDANPALLTVFGYSTREELLTRNALDFFIDAEDRERCRTLLADEGHVSGVEARMRRRDGSVIWARLNIRAARQGDTVWWEGSLEDITESRLLARQLQESRRLESIGRLAGGIAHEFNNLLQVVLGHTDLLLVKVPVEDPRRSGLTQIRDAGMRAHSLVRQLVAFGRRQILDTRPTDLNGLIIHQESILRSLLGERVKVALELEPALRPALVDPCQIEQVVATLCLNGRDAMAEGGTLTIRTWNSPHGGDESLGDPKVKEGDFVGLAVADSGDGMSSETLDRIFEPFFTTKDPVNGAGLGLAVVHGVITQHGGWLKVSSAPGRGSEFRVFLPACPCAVEASRGKPAEPPGPRGNAQCLLVIEDDEVIRKMTAEALRENGYQVLEAGTRDAAMAQYAAHEEVIDLLFTDVVLPDGSGMDLVSRILAIRPELRVLLTSGYVESVPEGTIGDRSLPFIPKPYCIDEMLRAVHRALRARMEAGG